MGLVCCFEVLLFSLVVWVRYFTSLLFVFCVSGWFSCLVGYLLGLVCGLL